jgi:hypothetical protein
MHFAKLKRIVTDVSTAIGIVAVNLYWGALSYRMATGGGGDIDCSQGGVCVDRVCYGFFS